MDYSAFILDTLVKSLVTRHSREGWSS